MDVESKQTLDEAIERLKTGAQGAADEISERLTSETRAAIPEAVDEAHEAAVDIIARAVVEVGSTIAALDGWTVTVTVPEIIVRLNKPPAK